MIREHYVKVNLYNEETDEVSHHDVKLVCEIIDNSFDYVDVDGRTKTHNENARLVFVEAETDVEYLRKYFSFYRENAAHFVVEDINEIDLEYLP